MIRKILLITLLPTLCFAQVIDDKTDIKVLSGRAAVNEFREAHNKQYVGGVKVKDVEIELRSKMTWELSQAGYTGDRISNFFSLNEVYNIKSLGFKDKQEWGEVCKENEEIAQEYLDLWR